MTNLIQITHPPPPHTPTHTHTPKQKKALIDKKKSNSWKQPLNR